MAKRWATKNERLWVYRFLVARDGEQCLICERPPTKRRALEIDHIDNKSKNDDPDNLCLLCRSCNERMILCKVQDKMRLIRYKVLKHVCVCENSNKNDKGGNGRQDYGAVSQVQELIDYSSGSQEMKANAVFEKDFRKWLLAIVGHNGSYPKQEAINSGAERVGCSPVTTKRYLEKLTSTGGVLDIKENSLHQKVLVVKPHIIRDSLRLDDLITRTQKRIEKNITGKNICATTQASQD